MTSVDDEILSRAAAQPARTALVGPAGRTLTFGQLADGARRVAGGLAERGVRRGDVVALVADSSPDYAVALCGALAAGATVASATPRLAAPELARWLAACSAGLLVGGEAAAGTR